METLGIGIIGGGRILPAHAQAAKALPETRLTAIAETQSDRLAAATERYGCRGYSDYHELLADPEIDAVVIALPHFLHRDVTIAALEAGKHALVEKPLAMTVAECDAVLAAEAASGKSVMVAHSQHYFPVNLAARDWLTDGRIGELVMATDTWYKPFWEGVRPPWFLDAALGGGMWPMNGSHMIDRLCFLTGQRVTAVKARIGSPIHNLSATDSGMAYLEFDGGLSATIAHAGYRDGVNRFEAEFTGTQAQLRICGDGGVDTLWVSSSGAWEAHPIPAPTLALRDSTAAHNPIFTAQLQAFARAVLSGAPMPVTAAYGREIVQVMEACEESSRQGREVRLD